MGLDELGLVAGTDKSRVSNDYLRHYEEWFSSFRDQEINVIEIGVENGASLRTWESFFSKATIVGIDINPECKSHAGGRRVVQIGSQDDPEFLGSVAARFKPSIIIDDGSHETGLTKFCFDRLYPWLSSGGIYVIEDLYFATAIGSCTSLVEAAEDLATRNLDKDTQRGMRGYVNRTLDSIAFVRGAAALKKRDPGRHSGPALIDETRELVRSSGHAANWFHLAYFILENGGAIDDAVFAAQQAVELNPGHGVYHFRESELLARQGKLRESISAAERGVAIDASPEWLDHLKRVRAAYSQGDAAV